MKAIQEIQYHAKKKPLNSCHITCTSVIFTKFTPVEREFHTVFENISFSIL